MIKTEELRIGNFIQININGHSAYTTADVGHFMLEDKKFSAHYSGVPLNEEWLVKFGFWKRNDNSILYYYKGFMYNFPANLFFIKETGIEVHYVHHLQNLYFALTGEELTVNETTLK